MPFTIPHHPNYGKNSAKRGDEQPCIICGRPCKNPRFFVHLHGGGRVVVTEAEAAEMDEADDMGLYPVGPECLRAHPELKSYVTKG